jgi:hypothetical protein
MNFWDIKWAGSVRATDPDTSVEAAYSVHVQPVEIAIMDVIKDATEGCTAHEVSIKLSHIPLNTLTPRFATLARKGLIEDSGNRRPGRSGRMQRVMVANQGETYGRPEVEKRETSPAFKNSASGVFTQLPLLA